MGKARSVAAALWNRGGTVTLDPQPISDDDGGDMRATTDGEIVALTPVERAPTPRVLDQGSQATWD